MFVNNSEIFIDASCINDESGLLKSHFAIVIRFYVLIHGEEKEKSFHRINCWMWIGDGIF